jgi:hypothetical protein
MNDLPLAYCDSFVKALVILFPHELPDIPKPPYGWEFFARKIPVNLVKSIEVNDALVCKLLTEKISLVMIIMDIICILFKNATNEYIDRDTYDLTLRHIFYFVHIFATKKQIVENNSLIFDKALNRCAIAVGHVSVHS